MGNIARAVQRHLQARAVGEIQHELTRVVWMFRTSARRHSGGWPQAADHSARAKKVQNFPELGSFLDFPAQLTRFDKVNVNYAQGAEYPPPTVLAGLVALTSTVQENQGLNLRQGLLLFCHRLFLRLPQVLAMTVHLLLRAGPSGLI